MNYENEIHPSLRDTFVPLPSDPNIPLTKEQLDALFPHPEAWRDVIALTMKRHGIDPHDVVIDEEIER